MVKVLIIDDSAVMRQFLTSIFDSDPNLEVVGSAMDPFIAVKKIQDLKPDVITLDIEMPRMDGLTFLSKLMIASPTPVIMVSSLTDSGAEKSIKSLQIGAVDVALKPSLSNENEKNEFKKMILEKIYIAVSSKIKKRDPNKKVLEVTEKFSADVIIKKQNMVNLKKGSEKVIIVGASTGGTEVIEDILASIPGDLPGILIAQHMPEKFTLAFANRVNGKSLVSVKEAVDGDRVYHGMAFIAPGGKHMLLKSDSDGYYIEINDGPPVNRHKPSVDVLFRSASLVADSSALGIICTGMGDDGAKGLLEMKNAGATTIAQNEESCVVFGMPNEAIKLGGATHVGNVENIINFIKGYT